MPASSSVPAAGGPDGGPAGPPGLGAGIGAAAAATVSFLAAVHPSRAALVRGAKGQATRWPG
eukprot:10989322-Alexandrium_andersonii.AAC.1